MIELFSYFHMELNKQSHHSGMNPITVDIYSKVVKLSVLGVEFRDKLFVKYREIDAMTLINKNSAGAERPMLLGHAGQQIPGQS